MPAPEVFLSPVAAKTSSQRVSSHIHLLQHLLTEHDNTQASLWVTEALYLASDHFVCKFLRL